MTHALAAPPETRNPDGEVRRVGVEIEFGGLDAEAAATLVAELFAGRVAMDNPHRFVVGGTPWGDFTVELDTKYAHPEAAADEAVEAIEDEWRREGARIASQLDAKLREAVGHVAASVVPTEIVCPPIPWDALPALDPLFQRLGERRAEGTDESPLYAFGLHLNVEVAATTVDYVLAVLRAYCLLSEWLREQIDVDVTRRLLPHASPFPAEYVLRVLAPDYAPDLEALAADYIAANPTRNRELDLLPLLSHLAPATVAARIADDRVAARPTFHYRLPNAAFIDPEWTAVVEWNRWVKVERLAADRERLAATAAAYIDWLTRPLGERWWHAVEDFFASL